jgi:hypothetical protein
LTYNQQFLKLIEANGGNLTERAFKQKDLSAAVDDVYLAIFSRPPTAEERTRGVEFLSADESQRKLLCRELVWALLCSAEFRLNH